MTRDDKLARLASIIENYRKGELTLTLDASHVGKWLSQFSLENQDTILSETIHIFESWYFRNEIVDEKIDKIVTFLQKKYKLGSETEVLRSVSFLQIQKDGQSQHIMFSRFARRVHERYGMQIISEIRIGTSIYVYFDDGLYTGSRARKDLVDCISCLPNGAQLEIFYLVAGESAFQYVKRVIKDVAERNNIVISLHRFKTIQNDKTFKWNADRTEKSWFAHQYCLWPDKSLRMVDEIRSYQDYIEKMGDNYEKMMYRSYPWRDDPGIFTSVNNRSIVEKEFLLKGIEILKNVSESKGIYPLGYNLWPSFGFGSYCAFDMNISNTCPLVLWWGNNDATGDALDAWYPLLPRRVNGNNSKTISPDDLEIWGEINSMDQYNMCPDCGCYFGIEEDGGNGFCVDCAPRH